MTLNYQKIWNVMNDLEMVTTKISSAREILDSAIDKLEEHQYDKAGTLLYAADEFLQYYLQEFDTKFKDAWKETVSKVKQQEIDDCMPPWGHSDMEALRYTDKEMDAMCDNAAKQDKVVKWQLPVEEGTDCITGEQEYFVTFPDDLLEAANLKPGDDVEWVDRNDGSFLLRKTTQSKTYTEMVAAGYTMTADGFWIKE
jgi:antitoxin component of MazEF toxin-antitoxin module